MSFQSNKIKLYKEELKKRYCYIFENTLYILAPYLYKKSEFSEEIKISKMDIDSLMVIEEILLSDCSYEKTIGYQRLEELKKDIKYLKRVNNGLKLISSYNKIKLNCLDIFSQIYEFIDNQGIDLESKLKKLNVIDEYCRISRFTNDGKIWTSGYKINCKDAVLHKVNNIQSNYLKNNRKIEYNGIVKNDFIELFSTYNISLSEDEKKEIYFKYHDEIPYNTNVFCRYERAPETLRPDITKPCRSEFKVNEEEIFSDGNSFYQLCPNCGFIVKIDGNLLSQGVKERILTKMYKKDYKIAYLTSELMALKKEKESKIKIKTM